MPDCKSKDSDPPGNGVTDSHDLPCECWEWNLCPLKEQPVLATPEPSLQTLSWIFKQI